MIRRKTGKIVCLSSIAGRIPIPYRSSLAASKHALQAFCDVLRAELSVHKIGVLIASPGYVAADDTDIAAVGSAASHEGTITESQRTPLSLDISSSEHSRIQCWNETSENRR